MLTNSCFYAFGDAFRVLHVHTKKHFNLGLEFSNVSHDPDKIILTTHLTLYEGQKFTIPPDKFEYWDYLLLLELLNRDTKDQSQN